MPYCPNCGYEYEVGIIKCSDCAADLVEFLPAENRLSGEDLELVYTCSDRIEAEMIKTNLESVGAEATLLVQKDQNYPGVGNFAVIKIFVPRSQVEDAKNYLENMNSQPESEEESD